MVDVQHATSEVHHAHRHLRLRGRRPVKAYSKLREQAPDAGTTGLRAVRELAAIIEVCSRAIEGVVDVLAGTRRLTQPTAGGRSPYDWDDRDEATPRPGRGAPTPDSGAGSRVAVPEQLGRPVVVDNLQA